MPNRPQFKTYQKQSPQTDQPEPDYGFQADDFLGGLQKDPSPDNIPDNAVQNLVNAIYLKGQLYVRNGLQIYSPSKPDSNRLMAVFTFYHNGTGINFIRATPNGLYKATASGWVAITGSVLHSTINDPWEFTVADNRVFFTNGGADVIQEINPTTLTYAALGDAPKYKYLCSAYSRVIGASLRSTTDVPYQVGWSGSLNYGEWNPLTDITAGSTPLVNSPSDLSDAITGIFALASLLCIVRQRSIWFGTFLPSGTNPFAFTVAVPRIGCDSPQTISLKADGLVFYNYQQSAVYDFVPGTYSTGQPIDISGPVKRAIKSAVIDPTLLFSSYNYDTDTYSLFIPNPNSQVVKCFSFNFTDKVWSYDEYTNISTVNDIDFPGSSTRIIDLTGTIAALSGTLNSLGGLVANANRFFGTASGDLYSQPLFTGDSSQISNIVSTDNGSSIPTTIDSKTLVNQNFDSYFNTLSLEYTPFSTGSLSIYYSKDDGLTFTLFKTITVTSQMLFQTQVILTRKPIRTRRFIWRITSSGVMYSINNYRVFAELAGLSVK